MDLDPEKKERILRAAFGEFAAHGYKNASTNRIVAASGIGKGMLFYYFGSKKELFDFLVDYGMTFIEEEYLRKVVKPEEGFIERYARAAQVKLEAYLRHPEIFTFLGKLYLEPEALGPELAARAEAMRAQSLRAFGGAEGAGRLRDDIPWDESARYIGWLMDGFERDITGKLRSGGWEQDNLQPMWDEFDIFLDRLRILFYRQGN